MSASDGNDMRQHRRANALALMRGVGAHRLDLSHNGIMLFQGPMPARAEPSQIDQNVTSGAFSPSKSRKWQLPGGELASMAAKWFSSSARMSAPQRSSSMMVIPSANALGHDGCATKISVVARCNSSAPQFVCALPWRGYVYRKSSGEC